MKFEGKIDKAEVIEVIEEVISEILKEIRKEVDFIRKDIYKLQEEMGVLNKFIELQDNSRERFK